MYTGLSSLFRQQQRGGERQVLRQLIVANPEDVEAEILFQGDAHVRAERLYGVPRPRGKTAGLAGCLRAYGAQLAGAGEEAEAARYLLFFF